MYPLLPIIILIFLFLIFWAGFYFIFAGVFQGLRLWVKHLSEKILQSRLKVWTVGRYPRIKGARQYIPIFIILGMGLLITFIAGDLFLDLANDFRRTDSSIYKADHTVNTWFAGERHLGLTTFFMFMTNAGGPVFLGIFIAIIATIFFFRKRTASAWFVIGTAVGGFLLNAGLKMIFTRARPDAAVAIAVADWYSFPSGHAMASFIILGTMAYLTLQLGANWILKSGLLSLIAVLVILVGMSRLYLGVHWISDIIAGWSAGTVWLGAAIVAYETLVRIRSIRDAKRSA